MRNPDRPECCPSRALPRLSAQFLLHLLDSDCVPSPAMVERHLTWLRDTDGVSLGIIRYTNARSNVWACYTRTRGRYRLGDGAPVPYHLFNTGNVAMRTRYFVELGGQDAAMTHYGGGDTEFTIRLWERYRLPYINNTAAFATSAMNKTLDQALEQMGEFGRHNLRYLYDKHPAHRHLYAMDLMAGRGVRSRLYRQMMRKWLAAVCRMVVPWAPRFLQPALVRYLVVYHVYLGFGGARSRA